MSNEKDYFDNNDVEEEVSHSSKNQEYEEGEEDVKDDMNSFPNQQKSTQAKIVKDQPYDMAYNVSNTEEGMKKLFKPL